MSDVLSWVLSGILVENVILTRFFGICPFLGVSKKRSSAAGMGFAVIFVMTISSLISWLLYTYVLVPMEMTYMGTIVFILVIASLVQIIEMFIKKFSPSLYRTLGIYLPLITTNCAILGMATVVTTEQFTFFKTLIYSFASGIGFLLVIYIFSFIRVKLERAPVPKYFKGVPIAFVVAGIMAMIFARFAGVA